MVNKLRANIHRSCGFRPPSFRECLKNVSFVEINSTPKLCIRRDKSSLIRKCSRNSRSISHSRSSIRLFTVSVTRRRSVHAKKAADKKTKPRTVSRTECSFSRRRKILHAPCISSELTWWFSTMPSKCLGLCLLSLNLINQS